MNNSDERDYAEEAANRALMEEGDGDTTYGVFLTLDELYEVWDAMRHMEHAFSVRHTVRATFSSAMTAIHDRLVAANQLEEGKDISEDV